MNLAIIQIILETDKHGRFILKPNLMISHITLMQLHFEFAVT
jgi:hypothetical protein